MRLAIKRAVGLAVIWGIAAIVIYAAHSSRPTPQAVVAFIDKTDFASKPDAEADRDLTTLADKLNRMTPENRLIVQRSDELGRAFRSMTPPEQGKFLDLTLPSGMKETMLALNKMAPEQRDIFVREALQRAGRNLGFDDGTVNKAAVDKVVAEGLSAFYSSASPEVKIQMAPVLEQLHESLQHL